MNGDMTPIPTRVEQETVHAEIVDGPTYQSYTNRNISFTEPSALIALALAVLSWFAIPIIGALAALYITPGAKRKIRASNGQCGGMKLAQAAQIIAIANLLAAAFIIWLLYEIITWIF